MSDTFDSGLANRPVRPPRRRRVHYDPAVGEGHEAYRAATRHSRLVRWLKFILPALALVAAGVFWGAARFIPSELADIVSIAGVDIESNSIVMRQPRISGFEGTRRAYNVSAASAVQNLSDPKVITFNQIDAQIGLDEAGTATIKAAVGVFDGNRNTLSLKDGLSITTSEGYLARFSTADIDLDSGRLVTDMPLEVSSAVATLRANSMRVEGHGERIFFEGGVSVSFHPVGDLMAQPSGGTSR